jgi:hypothetical protein
MQTVAESVSCAQPFNLERTIVFYRRLRRSLVGEPHLLGGIAPPAPQRTHDLACDDLPGAFK